MKKINKYSCYILLFIPLICFFTISFSEEVDIWFLLSHGRYVLEKGFPHIEFLTLHNGLHFVMQQWLSSVLFYIVYKYFGIMGIYYFVWLLLLIIIYFTYKLCITISQDTYISCIFTSLTTSLLCKYFITCRPNSISIIIFLILLYIMELYRKKQNNKIYFLIVLSFLEINLHAAMWPILFILISPYLLFYFINYIKNKDKTFFKLLFISILMFLIGFINPYELEAMTYSFRSYGIPEINNAVWEMKALNIGSKYDYVRSLSLMTYLIVIIAGVILIRARKKVDIYIYLLVFGTFLMALINIRNIFIFLICSLPFCTKYISPKIKYIYNNLKRYIIFYSLVVCCLIVIIICNKSNYILQDSKTGQKEILIYLNKNANKKDSIYTTNIYGGYFSFYRYKTYIDSRSEIFLKINNHKSDIFHEFFLVMTNNISYDEFLNKYKFKYLIIDEDEPLYHYLNSDRNKQYQQVLKEKKLYLFEKKN